jgi:hypothetical protein
MAFDKKKSEEIGRALESLRGPYLGQDLPEETVSLIESLTVGDLIIEFGFNVDQAAEVLRNIQLTRKKNLLPGFRVNEKPIKESKLIGRLRKIIKECGEEYAISLQKADDYHPVDNHSGGKKFEDHGAGEQAGMIKSNLYSIATKAQSLHDMVGDQDQLPEWIQEKIAVTDEYMDVIHDYLKYEYKRGH